MFPISYCKWSCCCSCYVTIPLKHIGCNSVTLQGAMSWTVRKDQVQPRGQPVTVPLGRKLCFFLRRESTFSVCEESTQKYLDYNLNVPIKSLFLIYSSLRPPNPNVTFVHCCPKNRYIIPAWTIFPNNYFHRLVRYLCLLKGPNLCCLSPKGLQCNYSSLHPSDTIHPKGSPLPVNHDLLIEIRLHYSLFEIYLLLRPGCSPEPGECV